MINNMTEEHYKKIAELDKKLKKDPINLDLLMQKAFIYFDGYDDENTIKTFKQIIKFYPNYINAYFWLSYYLYQIAPQPLEAIKIANEGLKIDSNRGDLHAVIAWASAFWDGYKNNNQFLYHINKAIELEPTWISTRISLIEYFIENKQYSEAKKEINETIKNIKDDFPAPKNDIEHEFEGAVTRRFDPTSRKTMQKFLNEIEDKEKK